MKRLLMAAATATALTISAPAYAADVGLSVSIGQPGFYGQIDIGDYPRPRVIYSQPMIIDRGIYMDRPPLYLHVPPGHSKNWRKHCHKYRACGQQVYFIRDDWYEREYVPRYQERHHERYNDRRDDRRDNRRDDRGGRGHDR